MNDFTYPQAFTNFSEIDEVFLGQGLEVHDREVHPDFLELTIQASDDLTLMPGFEHLVSAAATALNMRIFEIELVDSDLGMYRLVLLEAHDDRAGSPLATFSVDLEYEELLDDDEINTSLYQIAALIDQRVRSRPSWTAFDIAFSVEIKPRDLADEES